MKTKEQVIQEAWGVLWDGFNKTAKECALKNDGYVSSILENNLHQKYTYYNIDKGAWRPKSLQGIENNNGWVIITSQEDLPKEACLCLMIRRGTRDVRYGHHYCLNVDTHSHYKIIDTSEKPLY